MCSWGINDMLRILLIIVFLLLSGSTDFLKAEQFRYDPHGKRDPMVPLIGQEKPNGSVEFSDIVSIDDVRLEGIAGENSGNKTAIINGELVKENFKAGEVQVKKIRKNSVTLTISGKEFTVNLPEEGGQKSDQ